MPTAGKAAVIEKTKEWYKESSGLIFTDYRGLSVPEIQTLRQSLRDTGGEYHVVKNTLLRIAMGDEVANLPDELHNGPTATAFIFREEPACAKLLVKFAKDHKGFAIKGGFLDGRPLTAADIEAFSKLPGRQELLGMLVGLVAAPMSSVASLMNEMLAAPLRLIDAMIEKQGGAPAEAPSAPELAASEESAAPTASEQSGQSDTSDQTDEVSQTETPAEIPEETPAAPPEESQTETANEEQKEGQE